MTSAWQAAVEKELCARFLTLRSVGGGDFAAAYCATLENGSRLFVKTHHNPPPGFFVTESTGLTWLRQSQTVNIPRVMAVGESPAYLALQWVEQGSANRDTERQFGRQLAELHAVRQAKFGRVDEATTGSLSVPNSQLDSWSEFYATQRLLPLVKIAAQRQTLPAGQLKKIEKIAEQLGSFGVPEEPPSLLHGDLWAGNRIVDIDANSWVIDPAAHCGHREFELGMMALFGGFEEDCFMAYHEHYPLAAGWQQRLQLHQLAPLLVHAIKFGSGYFAAVHKVLNYYA